MKTVSGLTGMYWIVSMIGSPVWLVIAAAIPTALVCLTVVVLVALVPRSDRIKAIEALAPVLTVRGRRSIERSTKRASVSDKGHPTGTDDTYSDPDEAS